MPNKNLSAALKRPKRVHDTKPRSRNFKKSRKNKPSKHAVLTFLAELIFETDIKTHTFTKADVLRIVLALQQEFGKQVVEDRKSLLGLAIGIMWKKTFKEQKKKSKKSATK